MTAKPGQFVDDNSRYRLDARIATGGMGEVWRATDTTLGREVAVKVLKAEYADDATFRHRFSTEAQHAASLHHGNVAAVYDVGESHQSGVDDGSGVPRPYLVMELVEGEPLSTLLKQGQDAGQRMSPVALRELLAQAGDALGAAHRAGIVHRDVKPANLLVTPEGQLKITDFGIARAADSGGITQTGTVMGTPQYLSPEQAQGEPATVRSDVYSLGVVAYECLAGRRPFEADSPVATALAHIRTPVPDLPDDVPADLAAVVQRAMAKSPDDRFADGAAFAAALRDPATAVTEVVPPPVPVPPAAATQVMPATQQVRPATTPTQPPPDDDERRSPWAALLGALLVLALVVALLLWLANRDDEPDPAENTPSPTRTTETTPPETTEPTEDEGIEIDAGSYIGRPVDEVEAELESLGLNVKRNKVDNPGGEIEGLVNDVNPTGTLQEGDTVTVSYWGKAPKEEPETEAPETQAPETQEPETQEPETSPPGGGGGALEGEPDDGTATEVPTT